MVTQEWLGQIMALQELAQLSLAKAKVERAKVLSAMDAGAPVEFGRYKVRIWTRWRRRKIA